MTFTVKGRQYLLDGQSVPSVTTILDQWPKRLTKWAAGLVAGYAVDHWEELDGLPPSKRLRALEQSVWDKSETAKVRGTLIHSYGERLVSGEVVDVPPEYVGPAEAYARWLDAWNVTPVVVERPILNRARMYAGRPDALVLLGAAQIPTLIDIKTGGAVYESAALQLCAYGHAETWLDSNGTERDWEPPDQYAVVHVGSDTADLRMVEVDERTWRTFLYVYETWRWARECREAYEQGRAWPIGAPVPSDVDLTAVSR